MAANQPPDPMAGGQPAAPKPPLPGPQPAAAPAQPPAAPATPGGVPPAAAPGAAAPPPAAPAAQPPAAPGTPFAVFPTADAFNDRVSRAARTQMAKDLGMDPSQAKAALDRLAKIDADQKKKDEAELSDLERERKARTEAEAAKTAAEEGKAEAELNAHLLQVCAEKGIKNWKYAKFQILEKLDTLAEGEQLDERAYLDELAKEPTSAAALGLQAPAAPATHQQPATTTPAAGAPPGSPGGPPAQAAPGTQPAAKSAFDLNDSEWAAKKRALGLV